MATEVIHEHDHASGGSSGMIVGILLLAIVLFLLFYFFGSGNFLGGASTPQIQVPGQVDVNLNQK